MQRRRPARRSRLPLGIAAVLLGLAPLAPPSRADEFTTDVRPLLAEYCLKCHSAEARKGELDLEAFASAAAVRTRPDVWQKVVEQVRDGEMPPKGKPQPSAGQKARLLAWARATLDAVALERAGDPGRVVLRRLSNAEYTYTLRDLTRLGDAIDPAREFPADGAAGEGFTNTGQALAMSPALVTKYLDAAKGVSRHLVLLPDGVRFSPRATRQDWTNEILGEIRAFYAEHTDAGGGERVNLQGVAFSTNGGGRLPLQRYLEAAIELRHGRADPDAVARDRRLSAKYLRTLVALLDGTDPSPLLDDLRARYRAARPGGGDAAAMAAEVERWQRALWKFSPVGHIGKHDGPKAWLEPVSPLVAERELKLKLTPATPGGNEVVVHLAAGDAGDGSAGDFAVWRQPRLEVPGRPPLLLRDARTFARDAEAWRARVFVATERALAAAAEAEAAGGDRDVPALAKRHAVDADVLAAWFDCLGTAPVGPIQLDRFAKRISRTATYDFVKGWGSANTPSLVSNASDQPVRIPGDLKPRGVAVHPSPKLRAAVGWMSPVTARVRVAGAVTHAHPGCGNGVAWSLELRRGKARRRLAGGVIAPGKGAAFGPFGDVALREGDLVSLVVDPRDGNHACDLTDVELTLAAEGGRAWSLRGDVADDVLSGNPHADRAGNPGVCTSTPSPCPRPAAVRTRSSPKARCSRVGSRRPTRASGRGSRPRSGRCCTGPHNRRRAGRTHSSSGSFVP